MTLPPPTRSTANRNARLLFVGCLLFIIWCANPTKLYFLNDDFIHIPMAYDGTVGHHNGIRYINDFSLYLDSLLWKENATGYHFTNLLLYVANLLLAVPLLRYITTTLGYPVPQWMMVMMVSLFGVYAFHSEALFWILCRTASLSFFFNLLSWHCFFFSLRQRWWVLPMVVFFLLGIFTYESLWVYPVWLLLWYFLLPKKSSDKPRAVLPIAIIWAVFIAYFPYRRMKQGELLGSYEAADIQEFRPLSVVLKSARLFARSFLPPVQEPVWFATLSVGVIALLAVFVCLIRKSGKSDRLLLFFVLSWLVSYFPYIALGISTSGYESERYLYYPSFFLCAAAVYAIWLLWKYDPVKRNTVMAICFVYQLFFFIKAALVFQTISRYSRQGIEAIQQVPGNKQLIVRHLPVYSYGLPVFNYGFTKAVAWLAPQIDTARMQIESRTNFMKQGIEVKTKSSRQADIVSFISR